MIKFRVAFIFSLLSFVTGCMGPVIIDPAYKNNLGTIGVVNTLQSEIEGKKLGRTIIDNSYFISSSTEFDYPAYLESTISDVLAGKGYHVKSASGLGPRLRDLSNVKKKFSLSGAYGADKTTPYVREELLDLAEANGLDTVVLITPGYAGKMCAAGPYCNDNGNTGFGVFDDVVNSNFYAYYSVYLFIIKVPEYKVVLDGWARGRGELAQLKWSNSFESYTPDEKRRISSTIKEMIDQRIPVYLDQVGL